MKKILTLTKLVDGEGNFTWTNPAFDYVELRLGRKEFNELKRPGYVRITVEVLTADEAVAEELSQREAPALIRQCPMCKAVFTGPAARKVCTGSAVGAHIRTETEDITCGDPISGSS